jgi:hypothetical protein
MHAPILPMRRQAIGDTFRSRVRRGTLDIPYLVVHCLRHSYAVRLLREGVSLKNIGDVLGHRSTESTCVYLRLNVEDLREIALPLPVPSDEVTMRSNLGSCLSSLIRQYVKLKQALGRDFGREGRVLAHVDQFLSKAGASDFTQTEFEGWCRTQLHLSSGVRRGRMQVVRNFCLYRRRTEPNCFVPDDRLLPTRHQVVRPHIFSEMEIMRLLQAAARVPTSTPALCRGRSSCALPSSYSTRLDCGVGSSCV